MWIFAVMIYVLLVELRTYIFTSIVLQIRANQSIGVCGLNAPNHVAAGYRAETNSAKGNFADALKSDAIRSSVMVSVMLYLLLVYAKCL